MASYARKNSLAQTRGRKLPPLIEFEPTVSIVIPVRNEECFIGQCIRSLRQIEYPAEKVEIIFADGRSSDRTREIATANGCVVVDNPGLKISSGRNAGFAVSHGRIVAFTDADCIFDPSWLKKAIGYFRSDGIGGLSGPTPVPADQDSFGRAVSLVFEIAGMVGGTVHFNSIDQPMLVEDLPGCNALYRREALETVMPTNTDLFSNEDVEMNHELRKGGFKLLLTPDVAVQHYKRSSPAKFWRQMYVFAIGRLQLGKRNRSLLHASHWFVGLGIPAFALLFLAASCVVPNLLVTGVAVAALAVLAMLAYFNLKVSPGLGTNVIIALAIFVIAWPAGFMRELLFPLPRDGSLVSKK